MATQLLAAGVEYVLANNIIKSVVVGVVAIYAVRKVYASRYRKDPSRFSSTPGKLILHQFQRGLCCPNLSPFALKVETFLRISGIPYVVDESVPFGPKRKCPWVNLEDGSALGDSQFIIDAITAQEQNKSGHKRLPEIDGNLTDAQKAGLEGMVSIVEDRLFWCIIYYRYYLDNFTTFLTTQRFSLSTRFFFRMFMRQTIYKKCLSQGIACHEPHEVYLIARVCCRTLSNYLGDSPFFCGDAPGTADCAIFGGLSQIMWNAPGTRYESLLKDEFVNLHQYCMRVKEKVFPDWQELLLK